MAIAAALSAAAGYAQYAAPAGLRPAVRRPGAASILPGGRVIAPVGRQFITGPGSFGLAVGPNGRTVASANGGPDRFSLTLLERGRNAPWQTRHLVAKRRGERQEEAEEDEWRSVFMGLAFASDRALWASDGNSGKVRLFDLGSGATRRTIDLNSGEFHDSYTGDLAIDRERGLLYVVDQANFRLVTVDLRKGAPVASVRLGRLPFALALSPDRRMAYVTHIGMFEYKALPGADPKRIRETGLPFPAFGFPSPDSVNGARRETAAGAVDVPGLGDPNVREANSVAFVSLSDPASPKVEAMVPTGLPFGGAVSGGSSPSGVLATADRVYVSNGHNDTITVLDSKTYGKVGDIELRIPGLERYRGILPIGMAYHEQSGWLLVAEAGINAVAVVDTRKMAAIAHIPVGWFPTRVALNGDDVLVTNAKGHGTGPNVDRRGQALDSETFAGVLRRGSVTLFPLPGERELPGHTAVVLDASGFRPPPPGRSPTPELPLPKQVRYVMLVVKENRTFDEVFGDIETASNGRVAGLPVLARFGEQGYVSGRGRRLSLQNVNVTPNHHALVRRWAFSDNFYADSEVSVDGHHWLVGSYPNAWTESSLMASYGGQKNFRFPTSAPGRLLFAQSNSSVHPEEQLEAGAIWHHLERHGISFRNYGEGFELAGVDEGAGLKPTGARYLTNVPMPDPLYRNTCREYPNYNLNIPDQYRASQFIRDVEERYVKTGADLPRFLFVHLPNDHMAPPRPEDGYPYEASFVADNDYALGRMVEYLSRTRWWPQMAIFITEDDAQGGVDHIDSHRTVLIGAGPWFRKNYVSHRNSSFPGLLKTIFRLLGIPPLNLYDAAATDLSDMFADTAETGPYELLPVDARVFDPEKARDPLDPKPSPAMDDPRVLREQHRR